MLDPQVVFQAVRQNQDIRINPNTGIFNYLSMLNQGAYWVPITEEFDLLGHRVLGISNTQTSEVRALYHSSGMSNVVIISTQTLPPVPLPPTTQGVPRIFDLSNTPRDLGFVTGYYGASIVRVQAQPGENVWRIVEINEEEGDAVLKITTLNSAGMPQPHVQVARHWPGAGPLTNAMASRWKPNGDAAVTKEDPFPLSHGAFSFAVGGGDSYGPPDEHGVSAMWVCDPANKSDLADRLGWLNGTNHRRLDIVFQLVQE